jgi:lantibiotic transport system ATP-binding protein
VRELIIRLNRDFGKTIFLSSHLLSELEKCATELAIIDKGATLYQGSLEQLFEGAFQSNVLQLETSNNIIAKKLLEDHQYQLLPQDDDVLAVQVQDKKQVAKLNRFLIVNGLEVYRLSTHTQNLEELFLNITGGEAAPVTKQEPILAE